MDRKGIKIRYAFQLHLCVIGERLGPPSELMQSLALGHEDETALSVEKVAAGAGEGVGAVGRDIALAIAQLPRRRPAAIGHPAGRRLGSRS